MIRRIGILGAGAWGTALAVIAERAGREVILWPRRRPQAEALAAERENRLHLPGVRLAPAPRMPMRRIMDGLCSSWRGQS